MPDEQKKEVQIHTIPDKYYLGKKPVKSSKGALIVLVILFVIALGLGAAFFLTQGMFGNTNANTNTTQNTNITNSNPTINRPTNDNANANTNVVVNTNTNVNTSNANSAVNVNGATNAVFNGNTNTAVNTNTTVIPNSPDADADGLTDVEENLYGTGRDTADTDGDTFADGIELTSGYSPRGPEKLEGTNLVKSFTHTVMAYTVLYPTSWTANADPQTANGMIFSTSTGEFINVTVENNPAKLSARDWYVKLAPSVNTQSLATIQNTAKTLVGVLSPNGQTAYYTSGERAYAISYNTNLLSAANFRSTFQLMYKSFSINLAGTATNTTNSSNSNTNTNTSTTSNSTVNGASL
ncbi:MAG: hypothetical protein WC289_01610 [Patescibacteria group bacterium]|jgi:hypothetical protein